MLGLRVVVINNTNGDTVALLFVESEETHTLVLIVNTKLLPDIDAKMAGENVIGIYPNEVVTGMGDAHQRWFRITPPQNFNLVMFDFPKIVSYWVQ